jgi:glutaredoxin
MGKSCCSADKQTNNQTKKAVLYRMVTDEHICPYGIKSKDLLEKQGYEVEDHHLTTREETDAFKTEHDVETTPQTFIDGKRIGGHDDLMKFFGKEVKDKSETTYRPIIAIFLTTFFMALAGSWAILEEVNPIKVVELFIAFSMCVLAVQKLRDLEAFTNQFITYDILARRWVNYGYIYPFAEAFAGIGMIVGSLLTPIVAPVALFIGGIGAVSVIKAVYIDKRDLKCACVGGDSNVPLGFISLTENLMMIAMAIWMILNI